MSTITEEKKQEFVAEIAHWNWGQIVDHAKLNPQEDTDNNCLVGWAYLGTVFGLTPSGKIYTPFANSNVALCPACKGEGRIKNPMASPLIHAKLKDIDSQLRQFAMQEFGAHCEGRWPAGLQSLLTIMWDRVESYKSEHTCPNCDGLGSEEACWDELFREALEEAASELGGWIDHCDENIYFCIGIEDADTDKDDDEEGEPK